MAMTQLSATGHAGAEEDRGGSRESQGERGVTVIWENEWAAEVLGQPLPIWRVEMWSKRSFA